MMGVIVVGTLLLSKSILAIWINADYAKNSAQLLNILSIGVFFQALAVVPLRVLTATVFEKPVALIYLILSALYLLLSIYLSHIYSVIAIAILFSVKAVFEFVVLQDDEIKIEPDFSLATIFFQAIRFLVFSSFEEILSKNCKRTLEVFAHL